MALRATSVRAVLEILSCDQCGTPDNITITSGEGLMFIYTCTCGGVMTEPNLYPRVVFPDKNKMPELSLH